MILMPVPSFYKTQLNTLLSIKKFSFYLVLLLQ